MRTSYLGKDDAQPSVKNVPIAAHPKRALTSHGDIPRSPFLNMRFLGLISYRGFLRHAATQRASPHFAVVMAIVILRRLRRRTLDNGVIIAPLHYWELGRASGSGA